MTAKTPVYAATPVRDLPGIGPKRAELLRAKNITDAGRLLSLFPLRYEDHTHTVRLADAPADTPVAVCLTVSGRPSLIRYGGRTFVRITAADDSGSAAVTFFQLSRIPEWMEQGTELWLFGKVERMGRMFRMSSPSLSREPQTGLVPVYPRIPDVPAATLRTLMRKTLDAAVLPDPLPAELREKAGLLSWADALKAVHAPESEAMLSAGKRRFVYTDLLLLALRAKAAGSAAEKGHAPKIPASGASDFQSVLPFPLTGAQKRCIGEILADMEAPLGRPMRRLLQGDVGSGKTAVAAAAACAAVRAGHQAVLMVPTEILAQQQLATLERFLAPLGIRTGLLVSGMRAPQRRAVLDALGSGAIDVLVGTHAVQSDGVEYADLALVITDEQHRFGVNQRAKIAGKGEDPHLLVMSATPIPRTLAMALYGDLEVSRLDEMPPGRTPVQTLWVRENKRRAAYGFVESQLAQGRQAFVICPHIEDEEGSGSDIHTVTAHTETLREWLPGRRIECLHGQMDNKDAVMEAFARGEVHVLVSTTVVEVGVDVPNASVMVIENAERFGLSQLHQLRGRVGRGRWPGYCILFAEGEGQNLRARMDAFCSTTDGFAIAEADLELRGPGDFLGTRQSGVPGMASLLHAEPGMIDETRLAADALWREDPGLLHHLALREWMERTAQDNGI